MNTDAPMMFEKLQRRYKRIYHSHHQKLTLWQGENGRRNTPIPSSSLSSPAGASHWPNPLGRQEMREVE